ncbi:OB-fold protein [Lacticaseibacillus yichunensis]|uniref:Uncharacterized protein n=1 Tax=Lacticaseibacillus yichunensis TaxID=2486015 RepID=A0ABW4CPF9_9LACO|nr:hypothetical protein [Lacticaseibacillus yichunensis]
MFNLEETALYNSFYAGESPYNDAIVTVTGTVSYVGPDSYGLPCVEFGDVTTGTARVACVIGDTGLTVGERAAIIGHIEGFTQGMVVLKHCRLG